MHIVIYIVTGMLYSLQLVQGGDVGHDLLAFITHVDEVAALQGGTGGEAVLSEGWNRN